MQRILQKSRIITLLCYGIYALSPIYASLPDAHSMNGQKSASQNITEIGILWLNVLFGSFVAEGQNSDPSRSDRLEKQASQDENIVLIKKKRAVKNESYLVQPLLKANELPSREIEPHVTMPCSYEITRDMMHRHADGYYSLSTGLSPPSLVS